MFDLLKHPIRLAGVYWTFEGENNIRRSSFHNSKIYYSHTAHLDPNSDIQPSLLWA